jgi:hypothetical protein
VGENIDNLQENVEAIVDGNNEVGLEVHPEKTGYMLMPRYQKVGEKHSIRQRAGALKMWQSADIWEINQQIKVACTKGLRADYIRGTLATIRFTVF